MVLERRRKNCRAESEWLIGVSVLEIADIRSSSAHVMRRCEEAPANVRASVTLLLLLGISRRGPTGEDDAIRTAEVWSYRSCRMIVIRLSLMVVCDTLQGVRQLVSDEAVPAGGRLHERPAFQEAPNSSATRA